MDWKEQLRPEEANRLDWLEAVITQFFAEKRRIYNRCRMRRFRAAKAGKRIVVEDLK